MTKGLAGCARMASCRRLYVTTGDDWRMIMPDDKFADVLIIDETRALVASWPQSISVVTMGSLVERRLFEGRATIHLQLVDGQLFVGSLGGKAAYFAARQRPALARQVDVTVSACTQSRPACGRGVGDVIMQRSGDCPTIDTRAKRRSAKRQGRGLARPAMATG